MTIKELLSNYAGDILIEVHEKQTYTFSTNTREYISTEILEKEIRRWCVSRSERKIVIFIKQ